jgi:GTP-binding protein
LISDRNGKVTPYASLAMVDRGILFVEPGTEVYEGMIIGERNNDEDLEVNITKEKKLTNHRASGSDETIPLRPPQLMSLDQCIEFIAENEFVEITPKSIRLRKTELNATQRALQKKKQNKT